MKHISLVKIIVALCICNVYVFTCGVMGVVGDGKSVVDNSPEGVMGSGDATDEELSGTGEALPSGVGTVDFIVPNATQTETKLLEELHFASPGLAKSPVQSSYTPEDTEPPYIDTFEALAPAEETDEPQEIHIVDTYEPEPEPPATTPAATTTPATTPATTTSPNQPRTPHSAHAHPHEA
ncbi:MAG: hypothetical protein K2G32_10645, partial [Oscillospiraceae bacterium]|nr:hypothetical protein [Oscillospiraceae bacterium]